MIEELAEVRIDGTAERIVVVITGEVDLSNADTIQRRIQAALGSAGHLVIDLSDLRYLDSRGVRLLYELARLVPGRNFVLVAPAESVAGQLLEVTRLGDLVSVVESIADIA